ncbi:MAG TPA: hypothetical protein VKR32_17285, partial [Puia sp.]|nr:hypothetical protein [Puia sp.]
MKKTSSLYKGMAMRSKIKLFCFLTAVPFLSSFCDAQQAESTCNPLDTTQWVQTSKGCLHIYAFLSDSVASKPNLVIVIHGDAPFSNPGYQYKMARQISKRHKNTIAVGLLRPGYIDADGNKSDGQKGLTTGDNYTPEIIDEIAEVISILAARYHPGEVILLGHSGGAAI